MGIKIGCNHNWRLLTYIEETEAEYYYCIHCLAEAMIYSSEGNIIITERKVKNE